MDREKQSNLTVDKPDRRSLTWVIKVDIIGHDHKHPLYDVMAMTFHLCGNPPQTHHLSLTLRETKQIQIKGYSMKYQPAHFKIVKVFKNKGHLRNCYRPDKAKEI